MAQIGLYEAKMRLSELAKRVSETGEPITLTKRGKPFVDLVPHINPDEVERRGRMTKWLAELSEFHKAHPSPKEGIDQLLADIAEGRNRLADR
ncbi:MAG TPA: type II toxin-antitoxin system prevent-host-death family antitoxin [Tepidisphaeraceae bacterium]